jgi:hypothetical protein
VPSATITRLRPDEPSSAKFTQSRHKAGEVIAEEGSSGRSLVIVADGTVELTLSGPYKAAEQRNGAQRTGTDRAALVLKAEIDAAGLGQHHGAAVDPVDAARESTPAEFPKHRKETTTDEWTGSERERIRRAQSSDRDRHQRPRRRRTELACTITLLIATCPSRAY